MESNPVRRHGFLRPVARSGVWLVVCAAVGCGSGGSGSVDLEAASVQGGASGASAVLLLEETFDLGGFAPQWNSTHLREELYAGVDPFPEVDGHGRVMHYFIPPGGDNFTPIQVGVSGAGGFAAVTGTPEIDEFYIEWEEFFEEDHDFANGSQKMLRFTRNPEGGRRVGTEVNFWVQLDNGNMQLFFYHPDGNDGAAIDLFHSTGQGIPLNRWVKFGVWCRLNSPGEQDGFGRVYLDDSLFIDMSAISNRGEYTGGWNEMWLGGTHTNWGATTRESSRFIDNIRWYATRPGG